MLNAEERKVLIACGVIAGFICAAPGDLGSAAVAWGISLALYIGHVRLLNRETGARPAEDRARRA